MTGPTPGCDHPWDAVCSAEGSFAEVLGAVTVAGSTMAHPHPQAAVLLRGAGGGIAKAPYIFPGLKKLPLREFASDLGKGDL